MTPPAGIVRVLLTVHIYVLHDIVWLNLTDQLYLER